MTTTEETGLVELKQRATDAVNVHFGNVAAETIVSSILADMPESSIAGHIPLDVIALAEQRLVRMPLSPEYELHALACDTCRRNLDYIAANCGDIETLPNAAEGRGWSDIPFDGEPAKMNKPLLDALNRAEKSGGKAKLKVAVRGLDDQLFDDVALDALENAASNGTGISIITAPVAVAENGLTYFERLLSLNDDISNDVHLYVADGFSELAYITCDRYVLFLSLEQRRDWQVHAVYEPTSSDTCRYADYIDDRFDRAFALPDVRLLRDPADEIASYGKDGFWKLYGAAKKTGLAWFGKYGLAAACMA